VNGYHKTNPVPAAKKMIEGPFARQDVWVSLRADATSLTQSLKGQIPLTAELTNKFDSVDAAKELCHWLIGELIVSINDFPLSQLVPRAAGLSELLHQLNEKIRENQEDDTPAGLLKRPHHELTTTRKEDGEIVAREVQLRDLLPPRARQAKLGTIPDAPDERLERLGIRAGHVATLFTNGNVAIWTTRGHSLHEEPMERVQYFSTGISQVTNVRAFELSEVAEGPRLLITATFDSTPNVQLWDAGEAKLSRNYGNSAGATFASTPRGLEVALVKGEAVELHTTEAVASPRLPLLFKDGVIPTTFDGAVAYHDEIQVVAAARQFERTKPDGTKETIGEVLFWRDMGRPENKTPFLRFELQATKAATHIQPVTLPSGAGFVIASTDTEKGLFFVDPFSRQVDTKRQPIPTVIDKTSLAVAQLAVDRRELKVSAVISNKVYTYDLLTLANPRKEYDGTLVAVLFGRDDGQDESYLALSDAGTVKIRHLDEADSLQTLPKPEGFGADGTGKIVAITSALQTARTAAAAGDPLSLFHLWERMGFAVDIAAQDKTTRLFRIEELRTKVREVVTAMGSPITINKERHYVYLVEGEEPDAEFREDRVGFSHVNVAVVPEAFLAACLDWNTAPLEKWLENRSIKLAPIEAEKQRELEYLTHMTQLVGVPLPSRFGTVVGSTDTPAVPRGGELRLQPRSDRFVRVPASAGFSHWSWTLPDRKGHRILVAARRVSRYEPLLRWYLNLHTRFDLAEEVPLKRVDSSETVHTVASPLSKVAVTLNSKLKPSTGWQPLRIEFVDGPGTGQRREILSIDAATLKLDEGDPLLVELVVDQSKCRVMDAAPGWRLVVLDAIHDPAYGEGAKPLMVYQYPHSRKPRFSYQIPLDGMRATYNQISRVRTGYHGIEAAFRYYLPDRIDNPEAATLGAILSAIASSTDTPKTPAIIVTTVAGGAEPDVRLFRHERMASLPGLPFFYRYRLDVRSAYKARQLEWDRTTAAERLPDDENASPSAQRLPALLGLNEMELRPLTGTLSANQPTDLTKVRLFGSGEFKGNLRLRVHETSEGPWIEKAVKNWEAGVLTVDSAYPQQPAEGWEYQVVGVFEAVHYVSTNRDHLSQEEARSEPAAVSFEVAGQQVQACDLPDFFMDYRMYRLQQAGAGSLPSLGDLFSVIGSIQMPWSPNFKVPNTFPTEAKKKPFVSVASGVKLVRLTGDSPPADLGQEASLEIKLVTISGTPYWCIRFWIANEPGQTIVEKDSVFIQAARDGKPTRAVKCTMPD